MHAVQFIVPERSRSAAHRLFRLSGARVATKPTPGLSHIVLVPMDDLRGDRAGKTMRWAQDTIAEIRETAPRNPPAVVLASFASALEDMDAPPVLKAIMALGAMIAAVWWDLTPIIAGDDGIRRLLRARQLDASASLISSADVRGRELFVWSCEPKLYQISADAIPALAALDDAALQAFTVSKSGSRMHWDAGDVDLDLDAVREIADPTVRARNEARARDEAARLGRAIGVLRVRHGLAQSAIPGVTARQLRRLEAGGVRPHAGTLKKLAWAHGMTLKEYVDALARASSRQSTRRRRPPERKRR